MSQRLLKQCLSWCRELRKVDNICICSAKSSAASRVEQSSVFCVGRAQAQGSELKLLIADIASGNGPLALLADLPVHMVIHLHGLSPG